MAVTKKDIQELLEAQTKTLDKRFEPLEKAVTKMAKTLDRTTIMVANLHEDMKDVKADLKDVRQTVNAHTDSLDAILKNTEHTKAETAALKSKTDRHERWIAKVAPLVDVKLEP